MPDSMCPSDETLHCFTVGRLGTQQWQAIADHVQQCESCVGRLETLDEPIDELLEQLRRVPAEQAEANGDNERWACAVLSRTVWLENGGGQIVADAGRDLARRLVEGPVRLDRFELHSELGGGSFGYVFRAWDPRLERIVALKVQRAGSLASDGESQRFLSEARSAAQLKHPAIVSLYETGQTEDGVCFLVCEYVDGVTLENRLKDGPLETHAVVQFAIELADALQYAHEHGVIHRDIKPSNIIIDRRERAHLMDFGLAKRDTAEPTVTSDGCVLGTPAYMSPEQARGASHEVDARSDVYSLGVVLYEMLTGERPFQGNRRLLLLQVLEDDPRPLRSLTPDVPRDLEVICLKAIAKLPSRRYGSAREFADDLRRYEQGRPILARPMGYIERTLRWCRRYPLAVSMMAAVIAGSVAGLWHLSSLSELFVRQTALESVRRETKILDEVWQFYSEEIEDINSRTTNVSITEKYRTVHPSLPLPATFAIDLGERISRRNPGMQVRVYSRYPWPGRAEGGPQGRFDTAALEWLEANARPGAQPPAEYARFAEEQGRRTLLYYTARHMEQSCLGCHNDAKGQSPKKDWQVGDVVGVIKIVRPLDREIANTRAGLRGAFVLMGSISTLLLAISVVVSIATRHRRKADAA